jgi:hypothetical protein
MLGIVSQSDRMSGNHGMTFKDLPNGVTPLMFRGNVREAYRVLHNLLVLF